MDHRPLPLVLMLLSVAAAAPAWAQFPGIPGSEPRQRPIEMPRFRDRSPGRPTQGTPALVVVQRDGVRQAVGAGDVPPPPGDIAVAIVQDAGVLAAPGTAVLVLSDGQRLVGALDVDKGVPTWVSPWLAPRAVDLAMVRALVFPGGREPDVRDEDVVELRNGDRVTGAISSIMPDRIVVERGVGETAERFEVSMQDVLSVGIVGTDEPWTGVRAWLQDGTVLNAAKAEWLGGEHLQFPSLRGAKLPVASVPRRAVAAVQSGPAAAVPLAAMSAEASHPASIPPERRRESLPAPSPMDGTWPLDAPPIEIEGPVVLRYAGTGAPATLSCSVTRPAAARAAGVMELVVRSGGKEVRKERFGPDRPTSDLCVPLEPGPFELELTTPDGSIAGCFMVLRQALVLPSR